MPKIYSTDLRSRLVACVEVDGLSCREAARRYRVSASTAIKWVQRYRRKGSIEPDPVGGDRRSRLPSFRSWLLSLIEAEPDLRLKDIGLRLYETHGVKADPGMLSRFYRAQGISFKKKRASQRAAS